MTIRFDGRVAIVNRRGQRPWTRACAGLASRGPRSWSTISAHARRTGGSLTPAEAVVEEIRKTGGEAMADGADVSNYEQVKAMVAKATDKWGSVDLLCANAGILRDNPSPSAVRCTSSTFAKV